MDEEIESVENLLRTWQPRAPREEVTRRIALDLECPPSPPRWWQRLGFCHPGAALGWGLAVPALLVVGMLNLSAPAAPKEEPVQAKTEPPVPAVVPVLKPAGATTHRYATNDEGIILDARDRPVRRTRYRSEDTLAWRNTQTGAELQISYPREDVVTVPVTTR